MYIFFIHKKLTGYVKCRIKVILKHFALKKMQRGPVYSIFMIYRILHNIFEHFELNSIHNPDCVVRKSQIWLHSYLKSSLKDFLRMPHHYFCPTVKSKLSSWIWRMCCRLYHASIKSLKRHIKVIHKTVNTCTETRVRPLKVVARRAKEWMCLIQNLNEYQDVKLLNDVGILKTSSSYRKWASKQRLATNIQLLI